MTSCLFQFFLCQSVINITMFELVHHILVSKQHHSKHKTDYTVANYLRCQKLKRRNRSVILFLHQQSRVFHTQKMLSPTENNTIDLDPKVTHHGSGKVHYFVYGGYVRTSTVQHTGSCLTLHEHMLWSNLHRSQLDSRSLMIWGRTCSDLGHKSMDLNLNTLIEFFHSE